MPNKAKLTELDPFEEQLAGRPSMDPESGVLPAASMSLPPLLCDDESYPLDELDVPFSSESSVPVARVSLTRTIQTADDEISGVLRVISVRLRIAPSLSGGNEVYVTLSLPNGKIVFEGTASPREGLDVDVPIPEEAQEVRALVEAGTKYRNATLRFGSADEIAYEFR